MNKLTSSRDICPLKLDFLPRSFLGLVASLGQDLSNRLESTFAKNLIVATVASPPPLFGPNFVSTKCVASWIGTCDDLGKGIPLKIVKCRCPIHIQDTMGNDNTPICKSLGHGYHLYGIHVERITMNMSYPTKLKIF